MGHDIIKKNMYKIMRKTQMHMKTCECFKQRIRENNGDEKQQWTL